MQNTEHDREDCAPEECASCWGRAYCSGAADQAAKRAHDQDWD
jgi:sulfatase maturation enzyme AslB (radical SAM superfamily)